MTNSLSVKNFINLKSWLIKRYAILYLFWSLAKSFKICNCIVLFVEVGSSKIKNFGLSIIALAIAIVVFVHLKIHAGIYSVCQ